MTLMDWITLICGLAALFLLWSALAASAAEFFMDHRQRRDRSDD